MPPKKGKLTTKQQSFVDEYLVDLNATAAAIRAGYSPKWANKFACNLLGKNRQISEAIQSALAKRTERVEITQDMVLRELARVAFADLRSIYRPDGSMMSVSELSDDAAASVAGVESAEIADGSGDSKTVAGYIRKVKRWDKVKALELLGKHLGMYTDRVALSGDVSIPPLIQIAFVDASQKGESDKADKKMLP